MRTASHTKPTFFAAAQLMGSGWQQATNSRHNFGYYSSFIFPYSGSAVNIRRFSLAFSVSMGACFLPMADCSMNCLKYLHFQCLFQLFLVCLFFITGKEYSLCFISGMIIKMGLELNFLLVGSFLLSTEVVFLVLGFFQCPK